MDNQVQPPAADLEGNKFVVKVYEEICTNIRTSDDISFKLLGFVPLISGSGAAILTLGQIWGNTSNVAVLLISIVASIVTFGLFKWEMRNVQKCDWLIARAAELERIFFCAQTPGERRVISQFNGWSWQAKPPLFGRLPEFEAIEEPEKNKDRNSAGTRVGKTEAERIIYWASIAAWLVPIGIALMRLKV